jgi:hypothetical protein
MPFASFTEFIIITVIFIGLWRLLKPLQRSFEKFFRHFFKRKSPSNPDIIDVTPLSHSKNEESPK